MTRDLFIKEIIPNTVCMNPTGFIADELTVKQFEDMYPIFFDSIMDISKADISGIDGYGEFNDENKTEYTTCRDFLIDTFSVEKEGYWYHWKEMFETTVLKQDFFEKYYAKMQERIPYCEGKRYLVNNNTFFENMVTDGSNSVGFCDWSRAGITDYLLDIAILDLNKPYLYIPERFYEYCKAKGYEIPNFKERFLCMAYYKGIDTLRWHASIDDIESCNSMMKSLEELEDRIRKIEL